MTGCLCSRDGSFLYGDRSFPNKKMKGLVSSGQLVFPGFAPYSLACLYRNSTSAAAVERGSDDPAKSNVGSSWRGLGSEKDGLAAAFLSAQARFSFKRVACSENRLPILILLLNRGEQPFPILVSHECPHFTALAWRFFVALDEIS